MRKKHLKNHLAKKNSSYLLALSLLAMAFMPMLSNLDPMFSSNRWPNLNKKRGGGIHLSENLKQCGIANFLK